MLITKETQRHSTAFAYYLQLGGKRSYPQVARQFSVSVTSVKKWAQSFNWEQRVQQVDEKANAAQRDRAEEGYLQTAEDFRLLKYRTLGELKQRTDSGDCSVMELIQILRAVKVELGEPITITAAPAKPEVRNPFEEILQKLFPKKEDATV